MQGEPMKPKLKAPGTKRLQLKCDQRLQTLTSISPCAPTMRWAKYWESPWHRLDFTITMLGRALNPKP